tara:strand:- start:227 stop:409 length:183 start_codon:yes stop_codon:yes gene_type:complete
MFPNQVDLCKNPFAGFCGFLVLIAIFSGAFFCRRLLSYQVLSLQPWVGVEEPCISFIGRD